MSKYNKANVIRPILIVNGVEQPLDVNDLIEDDKESSLKSMSRKSSFKVISIRQEFNNGNDYKSPEKTKILRPKSEL